MQRASSELSLNLGILIDEEVTGAVGPDHSTGERPSRLPGNILEGQSQDEAGIKPVSEPVQQSSDTGKSGQITAKSLGDSTVGPAGKPPPQPPTIPTIYTASTTVRFLSTPDRSANPAQHHRRPIISCDWRTCMEQSSYQHHSINLFAIFQETT